MAPVGRPVQPRLYSENADGIQNAWICIHSREEYVENTFNVNGLQDLPRPWQMS